MWDADLTKSHDEESESCSNPDNRGICGPELHPRNWVTVPLGVSNWMDPSIHPSIRLRARIVCQAWPEHYYSSSYFPGTLLTATSASWIASSGFLLWSPFLALRRLSRGTFGRSGGVNRCHNIIQRAPTMLSAIRYTSGGDNLEEHRQADHRSPFSRPYYL